MRDGSIKKAFFVDISDLCKVYPEIVLWTTKVDIVCQKAHAMTSITRTVPYQPWLRTTLVHYECFGLQDSIACKACPVAL